MKAARHVANLILKSDRLYCNNCGKEYKEGQMGCENPQIGRHIDHVKGIIKQNKELQKERKNEIASNKNKSMRWGISIPPYFFREWETVFKRTQGEKLLGDNKDLHKFMKEFPAFKIAKKI